MLGLGLSLQKGVSAFNAGRALVSSYIRRVTSDGGVLQNTACDAAAINELNQDRLLEPASWVLVPDGIKEDVVYTQKPSTGLGDLTFTRASDATYTDSTGVVRRSPYNLLQFSEMFTDAYWTKNATGVNTAIGTNGIQPNVAIAPNGTLTADRVNLIPNTSILGLNRSMTAEASTTHSVSIYVKGEGSDIGKTFAVNMRRQTGGYIETNATVTLTGEWQRMIAPPLTLGAGNTGLDIRFYSNSTNNGASTALIWGAQLVEGSSALDYFPTTDRLNVPRIDFRNADGTLSSCGRLLLEPQRTNSIRNSSMVGAVAGSPGTLPTNWTGALSGLTRTVVGTGTENGLPYIDVRFNGTSTGTAVSLIFDGTQSIAAINGQTWTTSIWSKIVSNSSAGSITYQLSLIERNSSGGYLVDYVQSFTNTTTLQRFSFVRATANASTAFVQPVFYGVITNGAAYDFTIRIAAPQMELGGFVTTWVPTTTAAVTRLADAASKTGVSSLIGQTEGTVFVDCDLSAITQERRLITISNGTESQRLFIWALSNVLYFTSNAQSISLGAPPLGTAKIAVGYTISGGSTTYSIKVNNNTLITGTLAAAPTPLNVIHVGSSTTSALTLSDRVNQTLLFTTRLTNDQLEVLTSEGYGNYALLAQSLNCVLQ